MNPTNTDLLLALQLLTRTITDLPLAIQTVLSGAGGREPGPAPATATGARIPEAGGAAGGGGVAALGMVAAKFLAIVGPLTLLSAVVGSTISGFQTMGTAVRVLAGTLAPILLPVAVLLATALVALSDVVMATLMPGLEGFFGVILGLGIPVLVGFIDLLLEAGEELGKWAARLKEAKTAPDDAAEDARDALGKFADGIEDVVDRMDPTLTAEDRARTEEFRAIRDGAARDARLEAPTEETAGSKLVMGALRDVMTSLKMSVGPKAQISGLESVGRSAQLAALNQDPLEARMLRTQQMILGMMERAVAQMENDRNRTVFGPGGAFDGRGAGGGIVGGGDF